MRDITALLLRAVESSSSWPSRLGEAVRVLGAVAGSRLDWDRGAGERWARVVVGARAVLALSTVVPIAMIRMPCNPDLLAIIEEHGIVPIGVSDWEQRELAADPEVVAGAFSREDWSAEVDSRAFSAADLWWMTV